MALRLRPRTQASFIFLLLKGSIQHRYQKNPNNTRPHVGLQLMKDTHILLLCVCLDGWLRDRDRQICHCVCFPLSCESGSVQVCVSVSSEVCLVSISLDLVSHFGESHLCHMCSVSCDCKLRLRPTSLA